jgi:Na+-transporting methylmalonyl-CoA/oxaloacetate decarboxylase gamma subunit
MTVDWVKAGQIGGVGIGLVFIVLIILAVTIWLVGFVLNKISVRRAKTNGKKEQEQVP